MAKKIHIMHIVQTLETGGMENGLVNQINNINIEKFRVSVCCLNKSGVMENRIHSDRSHIIVVGQKPGKAYSLPFKLASIFKKEKVDIVYTHNCYAGFYGALAAKIHRKTLIHGQHGFDYDTDSEDIANIRKEQFICRFANHITCVSASLKDIVCKRLKTKESKVSIIPNGVDFDRFSKINCSINLKKKLNLDDNSMIIGSVGRLHYQKNYELLIRSFASLIQSYNLILILVGDGPERKKLCELALDLGVYNDIRIIGERDDIPDLLNIMDVFVLPSFLEGMSNTILEAMCAGLPVIASNVGGNPYIISDGISGFLFKSNSKEHLCDKLRCIIEDKKLRESMGEYSKNFVKDNYSISSMIMEYEELFLNTLMEL